MYLRVIALSIGLAGASFAQLTTEQKLSEFGQVAGLFAKGYGPHDWKKLAFGIDLYDNAKWFALIRATRSDVEFYDVMARWVGQLNDAHDYYANPSNFVAQLNFWVDIYDGKLLVDYIDRTRLPAGQYPIAHGYELVSIDGVDATKLLEDLLIYYVAANPRTTRRFAAELLTYRAQAYLPSAPLTPDISTVVFRRYDRGLETYRIPWTKTGVPLTSVGVYPDYLAAALGPRSTGDEVEPPVDGEADPLEITSRLLNFRLPRERMVVYYGATSPVFARSLPGNFVLRWGRLSTDPFYSGTFEASGYRIGFIRIPTFAPSDTSYAVTTFAREMAFFQENTDGLIVDIMRNGGGSSSYANALLSYLMFYRWRTVGVEIRATSAWIRDFSSSVQTLRSLNAPAALVQAYQDVLNALIEANRTNRGLTRPVPWDFGAGLERDPLRTPGGDLIPYTKPMLLLTDELSASASEGFAAIIQDNNRALLFGSRTMGAGGSVSSLQAGAFSGSTVYLTRSLMSRSVEKSPPGGYPPTRYVENAGVHPDYDVDYMTAANLYQNGKPFVDAFVSAMVEHLGRNK